MSERMSVKIRTDLLLKIKERNPSKKIQEVVDGLIERGLNENVKKPMRRMPTMSQM